MKIGIDARLWNETGVGRYIRSLTKNLSEIDKKNQYVLFLKSKEYKTIKLTNPLWSKVQANIKWHTVSEQLIMPFIYKSVNIDLLHIPYFSVPVFTTIPYIVTIHDLTISHFATGQATTKPFPIYLLKRIGYNFILKQALKKSKAVITVSQYIKNQLVQEMKTNPKKISITYESGEIENYKNTNNVIPYKFILYVGNAYPHKNLSNLIKTFQLVKQKNSSIKLILIGSCDYFYNKIKQNIDKDIYFTGNLSNSDLVNYYNQAEMLIFPSLSEGFGIPGLEAMSQKCAVTASDIPVFHEIYSNACHYFNPNKPSDIASKILDLLNNKNLTQSLIKKGMLQAKKYSWKKMAQETLKIYENCFSL